MEKNFLVPSLLHDSNHNEEVDTYEYNPDDKDSDGDVDYDDVEKHLNDSLEEDME
ncbi:hypothetical protein ACM6Q7_06940 [Peribacillus butanolivorans]|uniref:hypothetical protein n=1 Tax=Peribacillus butanolivorans TaxID=421767 RepID=UPI0039FD9DD3